MSATENAIANLSIHDTKISKETGLVTKECQNQQQQQHYIPPQVMVNILKRLPGKSLVRFMSVCKPWHSLTLNHFFLNLHFNHSLNNPNILIFDRNTVYSVLNYHNQLVIDKQFTAKVQRQEVSYTSNTCRGLVILYGSKWGYVLNPCTRKVEHLPKATPVGRDYNHPNLGLGFSAHTLEFKAVRIYESGRGTSCEVCTLGEGTWRPIEKEKEKGGIPFSVAECSPAYANNALFWIVKEKYNCILRFDVTTEEFTLVSVPPSLTRSVGAKSQLSLSVLHCCLCFIHFSLSSHNNNPVVYLYVLDDSTNGGFTWKCEHEIWPDMPYSDTISIVISNDKVLLFRPNWEIWYSYDLKEGTTCQLSTPQDSSVLRSVDSTPLLVSCEESIVPVPKITRRISKNKLVKE